MDPDQQNNNRQPEKKDWGNTPYEPWNKPTNPEVFDKNAWRAMHAQHFDHVQEKQEVELPNYPGLKPEDFCFSDIRDVHMMPIGQKIDFVGVLLNVGKPQTFKSKFGAKGERMRVNL